MNNYDDYCTKLLGKHGCTSEECKYCSVARIIAEHDSELLDKVAEKLKTDIEKYWYRSELDMGSENVNCLIDEVINELKAEVNQ